MKNLKIGIYGLGNFGYAILKHLSNKKLNDILYCFDRKIEVRNTIKKKKRHPYLHLDYKLNNTINVCSSPKELIKRVDILILCVTSDAIIDVANQIKKYSQKKIIILNTAKALCKKSGKLYSSILSNILSKKKYEYGILAGGTIASDLFKEEPLGITMAFNKKKDQLLLKKIFSNQNLKVYESSDVIGVEYASAFKNIISILAGIVNGLKYSFGSETHLISIASGEVKNLVLNHLGGSPCTFAMESQCWGNDLWMSCLGNSRNRKLGILIAKNDSFIKGLNEAKKNNITVEGINSIYSLEKFKMLNKVDFPILNSISTLPYKKPKRVIKKILEF